MHLKRYVLTTVCLPHLSPSFPGYICTLLTLMRWTLRLMLMFAVFAVVPDEVLWNIIRRFDLVFGSIISIPTDYISDAVFCVDVLEDIIDDINICLHASSGVGGTCLVARLVLYFLARVFMGRFPRPLFIACRSSFVLCVRCELFDWTCAFWLRARHRSVYWDYILYFVFIGCNRVWCRVKISKWREGLRQQLLSTFVRHLLGCSFDYRQSIYISIVAWSKNR